MGPGHGELVRLLQYTGRTQWALNSAVECHLHTVEVIGSNPIAPTRFFFVLHVVLVRLVRDLSARATMGAGPCAIPGEPQPR
jgi:hypothetical protein